METNEFILVMSKATECSDIVINAINKCNDSMDHVYAFMKHDMVRVASGVNETTIFDAMSIYDTDLEVLVNIIKKYFNELIIACDELEKNYKLITKEGNVTNYFLELDSSISLIIEDVKDFMVKAIKFNDYFDEYLKDNRVFDIDDIVKKIKENHSILFDFGNIHIVPFKRQHMILRKIEDKIHWFAVKNKPF